MPRCRSCHKPYVNGSILCPHCEADLDEPITMKDSTRLGVLRIPVQGVPQEIAIDQPTITLHVIEVDGTTFQEGQISATIPIKRLEVPVRIGRADLRQSPPIVPELDLTEVLNDFSRPVELQFISRLHAAIQLERGCPMLKRLVPHSRSTWVRHSRDGRNEPLAFNERRVLTHRDIITLGTPSGRCVKLRVVLSHPA